MVSYVTGQKYLVQMSDRMHYGQILYYKKKGKQIKAKSIPIYSHEVIVLSFSSQQYQY